MDDVEKIRTYLSYEKITNTRVKINLFLVKKYIFRRELLGISFNSLEKKASVSTKKKFQPRNAF